MKKITMLLLAILTAFALIGCQANTVIDGTQTSANPSAPTTIGTAATTIPIATTIPAETTLPTQPAPLPTTIPTVPSIPETVPTEPTIPSTEPHIHSFIGQVTAPSCTSAGYTLYTCDCGTSYKDDYKDALGHTWQNATCKAPKTCSVCHLTEGEKLEHQWDAGVVMKEATEETDGQICYTCTACQETKTQLIPALGHTHYYTEILVTYPTCTADGFTTHTCRCGDHYTDQQTPALGHAYAQSTQAPTCTQQGHTTYTCTRCGDSYQSESTNALGHQYTDATCTTPQTCTLCGHTTGTTLAHAWDQGVVIREATETADGEKRFTCQDCGTTNTQLIPALGHTHSYTAQITAPTCTEKGFTTYTCRCGDHYTADKTPALGHDWSSATCTAPKTCKTCAATEGKAKGHDWKSATCTAPKTCKTCATTEGTAKGHDWKSATCTAPKTCKTCAATEGNSLGHNYISGVCQRCGDKTTIPASFHIRFIDVGQADAALIECDGRYMLIDGGNKADADTICAILEEAGIQKLDILVATHAHADHIGGLAGVLNFVSTDLTLCPITAFDTKTFEDFANAANQNGNGITVPNVGDTYTLGSATITILSVNASKDDDNCGIILRIDYGATSFIFTGDAEKVAEQAAINSGLDLSATVLKIGKHGSDTGTTAAFLEAIDPQYAILSVGAENSYGHPTSAILNRLRDANVQLFRTDLQGDIFCTSDGSTVTFTVTKNPDADVFAAPSEEEPTPDPEPAPDPEPTPEGLQILSWPEIISRNETGTVTIRGKANTEYTITVYYKSGPATADGLEAKVSDAEGYVTWSWKVGGRTSPGTYKIVIEGGGETIEVEFTVTK